MIINSANNFFYKSLVTIALFAVMLGSYSCSDDSMETIETVETVVETIENSVTLTTAESSTVLNGFYFSCLKDDESGIQNILVYRENLRIENGVAVFEQPLFTQSWVTPDTITTGTYLSEGGVIEFGSGFSRFFEINVESNDGEIVAGNFRSVNYAGLDSLEEVEGSFSIFGLPCEAITISEDITEYVDGRTTLNLGEEERFLSTTVLCDSVFIDQELPTSLFLIGGIQHLNTGREFLDIRGDLEHIIYTDPTSEFEVDVIYPATLVSDDTQAVMETIDEGTTIEEARELGTPIFITYSRITETTSTGTILDISGEEIGEFNATIFSGISCN